MTFFSSCVDVDVIEISTYINGEKTDIDDICGEAEPQMVMSSGPRMIVTFRSFASANGVTLDNRGFLGQYSFVTSK